MNEWIERANDFHHSKYDYSKVVYKSGKDRVVIVCSKHGAFKQQAGNHLSGKGCPKCNGGTLMSKGEWLKKVQKTHGSFYDYSKVNFQGVKHKVLIVCPIHGDFWQIAEKHFLYGCQDCGENKPLTVKMFVKRAAKIHDNKYNYSLIKEINGKDSKVEIICPKHGLFEQIANNHLRGRGCKYCAVGNSSIKEQNWLDFIGLPRDILHRNVRMLVDDRYYIVDGCIPNSNVVFEFLGNYWHGNPSVFDADEYNKTTKCTFGELFQITVNKIQDLRKAGYKVVSIWEDKYDKNISDSRISGKSV